MTSVPIARIRIRLNDIEPAIWRERPRPCLDYFTGGPPARVNFCTRQSSEV